MSSLKKLCITILIIVSVILGGGIILLVGVTIAKPSVGTESTVAPTTTPSPPAIKVYSNDINTDGWSRGQIVSAGTVGMLAGDGTGIGQVFATVVSPKNTLVTVNVEGAVIQTNEDSIAGLVGQYLYIKPGIKPGDLRTDSYVIKPY